MNHERNVSCAGVKVLTKSFQTPPANARHKRQSETSGDEETEPQRPISLPTQRVTPTEGIAIDAKSTISEPIQTTSKQSAGSVSYPNAIHALKTLCF